jgi:hypothetical protein
MALKLAQFAPHRTVTHEVALLEDSPATRKADNKPDIIIGRDLIKLLGLTLDFAAEPAMILWEDVAVPIGPRGYWTKESLQAFFPIRAISVAEKTRVPVCRPLLMEKNRWICVP